MLNYDEDRRNWSAHMIRAHLQGFKPLSWVEFVRIRFNARLGK